MAVTVLGADTAVYENFREALDAYEVDHPRSSIDIYRLNSISVQIRVIDPDFAGVGRTERHARFWDYLGKLPDEVQGCITKLVLVTPPEKKRSGSNLEFEEMAPSIKKIVSRKGA